MKRALYCLVALTLLLPGCEEKKEGMAQMPPPLVGITTLESRNVPVSNTFVGQTEGSRAVEVRAQISGILVNRTYEEGSYVAKGQPMFEIAPDTNKAALEQAEGQLAQVQARYTQAQQDLSRVLNLYSKNAVSQRDRDQAQAAFDTARADMVSARAAVDEAKIKLGYAYVTAPVHGYAGKANRSVGNLINSASAELSLLTVVNQVDPIYANFSVPSPALMRLRTLEAEKRVSMDKISAYIELADGSRYPVPGKVNFIDKAVNPETSVVSARAEFANKDLFVLPGQFVRVTLTGMELLNAILIPQQAVVMTQKGTMVVVVDKEGKAEMRPVTLSDNIGEFILLEKGVKAGERIVVEGTNKAVPGQPVRIDEKFVAPVYKPTGVSDMPLTPEVPEVPNIPGSENNENPAPASNSTTPASAAPVSTSSAAVLRSAV